MLKRLKRFLAAMFAPNPYKKAQVRQPFDLNRSDVRSPMATRNSPRRVNSGLGVRSATSDHSSNNNHSSNGE